MVFKDDSAIKLGGVLLPGLIKKMEISDSAKVEEQDMQGSSTKPKQATGYEDAKIVIDLILEDSTEKTAVEKAEMIQALFRKANQKVPAPLPIVNEHTSVRQIHTIIFKGFTTSIDSKHSQIAAALELWSYVPVTIKAANARKKVNTPAPSTQTTVQSQAATLQPDYQAYLDNNRGLAGSPAVDDATATAYLDKVAALPLRGGGR
ncbi:transcriptional regulator [Oscillospiraceae bacterium OttesenSCG-928-F05]|nr:transcriptional regulator [Oscillospiraceae bacterium OttesenSCG-928-F05]